MKKGWETKTLGEVSAINYGYTESANSEPVGPRFLRITDIQDDHVDWESVPYCKIESANFPKYRLARGDIVFARTGATTGKSFLVDDPSDAVFASYLIRLRLLGKELLPEFVSLFFQTDGYWQSIKDGSSGSAQGGFNATKLGALSIPVPPLPEQQRIVDILDEAFAGLATAKANAEKNLQNARALFESHLQSVFTGRGKNWIKTTVGEIGKVSMCKRVFKDQTAATGDIPFYKIGTFGKEPDSFIPNSIYNDYRRKYPFPKKGDILISASGTIGRRVRYNGEPAYFQDSNIVWIDNDEEQVLNDYLYHVYGACEWNSTKGATISRLYNDNLKRVEIAFPKLLNEQRRIVSDLDTLSEETQRLAGVYERKLAALEALKKSLLHQAFTGNL